MFFYIVGLHCGTIEFQYQGLLKTTTTHPTRKTHVCNIQTEDVTNTTKLFCRLHPQCMWGTIKGIFVPKTRYIFQKLVALSAKSLL